MNLIRHLPDSRLAGMICLCLLAQLLASCADPLYYNPLEDPAAFTARLRNIEPFRPADYQKPDAPDPMTPDDVSMSNVAAIVRQGDPYRTYQPVQSPLDDAAQPAEPAAAPDQPAAPPPPTEIHLTLSEARAEALANNLELAVSLLSPTIAEQDVSEAEAAFESTFFANTFWTKTDTPVSTELDGSSVEAFSADAGIRIPLRTGGTVTLDLPISETETDNEFAILNPSYTSDFSASISHNLLRNAGIRTNEHPIRIAYLGERITEAQTKLAVIRVLAVTERLYWQLYAARQELNVRQQEIELANTQLERARRFVEAGAAAEVEVLRAESGLSDRVEALIVARNTLANRQRNLKQVLNRPDLPMDGPTIIIPATEPNPLRFQLEPGKLISIALRTRPELLQTELQLLQDASSIDFAKNQLLPLLLLDYTYNVNGLGASFGDSFDVLRDKNFEDHRMQVRGEVPLGNESAKSRLRRATLTRLQRIATQAQQQSTITQEVLASLSDLDTNWQRILASRLRTVLADRLYQAEVRQFGQGLRNSTDVLDAQTNLANARSAEIQALTDYQTSQINLAESTGMLLGATKVRWEPSSPDVDQR